MGILSVPLKILDILSVPFEISETSRYVVGRFNHKCVTVHQPAQRAVEALACVVVVLDVHHNLGPNVHGAETRLSP